MFKYNRQGKRVTWCIPVLVFLAIALIFLSRIVPPFMSPDEDNHIKRAYLLSKGHIFPISVQNKTSGGYIDNGLLKYIESYPFDIKKISLEKIQNLSHIKWGHESSYSSIDGIGYYFPAIYLPQALAFFLGENINLSIKHSVSLARIFNIISCCLVIYLSLQIYTKNLWPLSLLLLPMALFQESAASIDGLSFCLFILCMSIYLKMFYEVAYERKLIYLMAICEIVIITSRLQSLPILFLFLHLSIRKRSMEIFYIGLFTFIISTFVIIFNYHIVVYHVVPQTVSNMSIIKIYLMHPLKLYCVFSNTLSDSFTRKMYIHQFLGQLGWLDIPFNHRIYLTLKLLLLFIVVSSMSFQKSYIEEKFFLALLAFMSLFCVFFALLVSWTVYPSNNIEGVQGRYFYIPAILLFYAISLGDTRYFQARKIISMCLCVIIFIFSFYETSIFTFERYYGNINLYKIAQIIE